MDEHTAAELLRRYEENEEERRLLQEEILRAGYSVLRELESLPHDAPTRRKYLQKHPNSKALYLLFNEICDIRGI